MLTKTLSICIASIASLFPICSQAMAGANGEFTVGLGPVPLGDVVMTSHCNEDVCSYETRVKGSFMFIGAKINEKGTYKKIDRQVVPVTTQYAEKIGSKKRAFTYDFLTRKIKNKKNNTQTDMPDNVYPFMPLINQVILDLRSGGPREYYEFLSKQKIKRATITAYTKKLTKNGTLHHFVGKGKDDELEFFFLEHDGNIGLEKIAFGSFHMSRK
ncbi:hypothetical protein [Vibrio sp. F74]|uniref:hypothetical protein n=1 Tax=Vibrio sp. F74 TaxID=700020 RepID=UPI0035F54FE6